MRKTLLTLVVLLAVCGQGIPFASAQGPATGERFRSVDKALRWLAGEQNVDGGFGTPTSDPETTCSVVLAFAAAYEEPDSVQAGGDSPLNCLETQVATYASSAEGAARIILAAVAGNRDPRAFGGANLITTIEGYCQTSGRYMADSSDGIAAQALAILALQASKETVPPAAKTWLKNQRNVADGGWGPTPGNASDATSTALSLQALSSAGQSPSSTAVLAAVDYLKARQTADAGFAASATESESDPVSTAQAIQALLAAGENLLSTEYSRCLRTPFDALLDAQSGEGSFESDVLVTAVSTLGLMGRSLPLPGRGLAALRGLEWLSTQQRTDGGFVSGGITADAVYAITLCDQDPGGPDWTKSGGSTLDALEDLTPDYIADAPGDEPAGELAKVIRAVQAAGGDPNNFAGRPLVDELKDTYRAPTGRYDPNKVFSHDLALMALHAVSETIPAKAVTTIEDEQLAEGGWPWAWGGSTSDVDSTGLSMQALAAAGGPSSTSIFTDAADFLDDLRLSDGGFPDLASSSDTNCDATALAIQGLLAASRHRDEPLVFPTGHGGVASSWDALLALQEDAGSFAFTSAWPESRLLATLEAIQTLVSPLYPDYEPIFDGDATQAGAVYGRLTCGDDPEIVAPYSGDDNNDGSATLRYRGVGDTPWGGSTDMDKRGIAYLGQPGLDPGQEYEIEVTYTDADAVSGEMVQTLILYVGKVSVPLSLRSYDG